MADAEHATGSICGYYLIREWDPDQVPFFPHNPGRRFLLCHHDRVRQRDRMSWHRVKRHGNRFIVANLFWGEPISFILGHFLSENENIMLGFRNIIYE